jgi:endonuclease YncB( thermonuclease family)
VAHRSRHERAPFSHADDSSSEHGHAMQFVPLTVGTSFACIHETAASTSVGVVTKVIDGDTIHVLINGPDYKVRYIGMNTPEDTTKKEWLGPEATARDKELVAGKTVTLVKDVS